MRFISKEIIKLLDRDGLFHLVEYQSMLDAEVARIIGHKVIAFRQGGGFDYHSDHPSTDHRLTRGQDGNICDGHKYDFRPILVGQKRDHWHYPPNTGSDYNPNYDKNEQDFWELTGHQIAEGVICPQYSRSLDAIVPEVENNGLLHVAKLNFFMCDDSRSYFIDDGHGPLSYTYSDHPATSYCYFLLYRLLYLK